MESLVFGDGSVVECRFVAVRRGPDGQFADREAGGVDKVAPILVFAKKPSIGQPIEIDCGTSTAIGEKIIGLLRFSAFQDEAVVILIYKS